LKGVDDVPKIRQQGWISSLSRLATEAGPQECPYWRMIGMLPSNPASFSALSVKRASLGSEHKSIQKRMSSLRKSVLQEQQLDYFE